MYSIINVYVWFLATFLLSLGSVLFRLYYYHSWRPSLKSEENSQIIASGLTGMLIGMFSSAISVLTLMLISGLSTTTPAAGNIVIAVMLAGSFIGTWISVYRQFCGVSHIDCLKSILKTNILAR